MKIYFDNVKFDYTRSGPNCFAHRLAIALSKRGHIIADPDDYEIALCFIQSTKHLNLKKPYVHRLDGIWFHPNQLSTTGIGKENASIKNTYDQATSVIFQSEFDKKMVQKWFGIQETNFVIPNGIEIKDIEISSPDILHLKQQYEKIFVCSANWHGQKRLKDNISLYLNIKSRYPNSCLVIMGFGAEEFISRDLRHPKNNIFVTGSQPHEICMQFYSVADWMIHLAWADHCPNVVVEALSQGCPVVCSETGGTKELVGENGIILKEEYEYDFEAYDYDNPPRIDIEQINELPVVSVDRAMVDLDRVVDKYEKVLEKALLSRTT